MQGSHDNNRIDVFLDDDPQPLASYSPPLRFELDTSALAGQRSEVSFDVSASTGRDADFCLTWETR